MLSLEIMLNLGSLCVELYFYCTFTDLNYYFFDARERVTIRSYENIGAKYG